MANGDDMEFINQALGFDDNADDGDGYDPEEYDEDLEDTEEDTEYEEDDDGLFEEEDDGYDEDAEDEDEDDSEYGFDEGDISGDSAYEERPDFGESDESSVDITGNSNNDESGSSESTYDPSYDGSDEEPSIFDFESGDVSEDGYTEGEIEYDDGGETDIYSGESDGADDTDEDDEEEYDDDMEFDLGNSAEDLINNGEVDESTFVGMSNDGEIIEDDRESLVDEYGNLKVMGGNTENAFEFKYIDIDNIVVSERIRKNNNSEALTMSVKNTGLLMPLIVAPTSTEGVYVLIHGLKRLISCAKSGIRSIPCIVNKNAKSTELKILEALYNHGTSYTIREMVAYIDYLEKERNINNPSTIEYLLQLDVGDYTKLKDVINDGDEDIVTPLMNGQITIAQAFKKLESRRKKESREEKEDRKAADVYSNTAESGASAIDEVGEVGDENVQLTPEELKDLGFTQDKLDDGLEDQSLEEMIDDGKKMEGYEPHKQDWKNRERLDPVLRKAVLARDNNTSRVDPSISGQEYTECLDVHHIHEVYLGGTDDIDNLITIDIISHKLIHLWARGELHIGDLESMDEAQREKFKRIIKLGNVIREDMKARGMKIDELKKVDKAETIGRTKPGTGQVAG